MRDFPLVFLLALKIKRSSARKKTSVIAKNDTQSFFPLKRSLLVQIPLYTSVNNKKRYFQEFSYRLELACFLVIYLALLGVILLVSLVVILFATLTVILYSPLLLSTAEGNITCEANITHEVHITRRKANITEKRQVETCRFFWLGMRDLNPRVTESESVALPLGESPLFRLKRPLSQIIILHITLILQVF